MSTYIPKRASGCFVGLVWGLGEEAGSLWKQGNGTDRGALNTVLLRAFLCMTLKYVAGAESASPISALPHA